MINKKIIWVLMVFLIVSLLSVVVFARPPQTLCCDDSTDCVIWLRCEDSGTSPYDVDGDGDSDYCLNREWWDCGSDSNCPSNQWCTGSGGSPRYDCVADLGLCSACSRSAQCASGTTCISSKCRVATTEANCGDGKDNDCDNLIDMADPDCCKDEGGSCSSDAQCCGAMKCDGPGSTCGCPTGYDWVGTPVNDCVPQGESCGIPPSNCDTNPYQTACLSTYIPWNPVQGCCEYGTYGGSTDYTWSDITTY